MLERMETPEESPVPLAWDSTGEPLGAAYTHRPDDALMFLALGQGMVCRWTKPSRSIGLRTPLLSATGGLASKLT
jgi:hypothetical protein